MWSGPVLEVGILAGLVTRGRVHRLRSLPVLLVGLLGSGAAVALWPSLRTWTFWTAKEALHALLFLAVGLETSARIFGHLPGAALVARAWLVVVTVVTMAVIALPPYGHPALTLIPKLLGGTAWLYLGLLATRLFFRMPLDPLHRAVLLSVGPYMMLYAYTWGRVDSGFGVAQTGLLNALAFVAVLVVLLVASWRDERPPTGAPETVRFLWSWSS